MVELLAFDKVYALLMPSVWMINNNGDMIC